MFFPFASVTYHLFYKSETLLTQLSDISQENIWSCFSNLTDFFGYRGNGIFDNQRKTNLKKTHQCTEGIAEKVERTSVNLVLVQ